jgi:hypothetical protein
LLSNRTLSQILLASNNVHQNRNQDEIIEVDVHPPVVIEEQPKARSRSRSPRNEEITLPRMASATLTMDQPAVRRVKSEWLNYRKYSVSLPNTSGMLLY